MTNSNPYFSPDISSDEIYFGQDMTTCITDVVDDKADASHSHTVSNISDLTATATELNYMDGVTSNVQTQLDGKAASSHSHSYLPLTGGTLTGDVKLNGKDLYTTDIYITENGNGKGVIYGKTSSGTYLRNIQPCNENGNCVIGWGGYTAGTGSTHIYGSDVNIFVKNTDGTTPSGSIFIGRNTNNHTLLNYGGYLDGNSNTYLYGDGVHVRSKSNDFTVDGTQLAHTDSATITSLSSGWAVYGSSTTPTVRRYGKVVSLTGAVKNSSAVTLNTTHVEVFAVPSGYRPSQDIISVCQGSGANKFILQIKTDGSASIGRYGTTSFSEVAAGAWFPFHVTWIMD